MRREIGAPGPAPPPPEPASDAAAARQEPPRRSRRAGLGAVSAPPATNVLLVSIDTLRADHFGCYGHFRDTPGYGE